MSESNRVEMEKFDIGPDSKHYITGPREIRIRGCSPGRTKNDGTLSSRRPVLLRPAPAAYIYIRHERTSKL